MSFSARVAAICAGLPGAAVSDPWGDGHDAWKIGGKIFACIGAVTPGVSVKCPDIDSATMLIEAGIGIKAPYFRRSWILLLETVAEDHLRHRLLTSYSLIRAGLTAAIRGTLAPMEGV
jgi:predicted DNA-binding protein (MmcQ/YjbR family)